MFVLLWALITIACYLCLKVYEIINQFKVYKDLLKTFEFLKILFFSIFEDEEKSFGEF